MPRKINCYKKAIIICPDNKGVECQYTANIGTCKSNENIIIYKEGNAVYLTTMQTMGIKPFLDSKNEMKYIDYSLFSVCRMVLDVMLLGIYHTWYVVMLEL